MNDTHKRVACCGTPVLVVLGFELLEKNKSGVRLYSIARAKKNKTRAYYAHAHRIYNKQYHLLLLCRNLNTINEVPIILEYSIMYYNNNIIYLPSSTAV